MEFEALMTNAGQRWQNNAPVQAEGMQILQQRSLLICYERRLGVSRVVHADKRNRSAKS
jgi:hypothetical protein